MGCACCLCTLCMMYIYCPQHLAAAQLHRKCKKSRPEKPTFCQNVRHFGKQFIKFIAFCIKKCLIKSALLLETTVIQPEWQILRHCQIHACASRTNLQRTPFLSSRRRLLSLIVAGLLPRPLPQIRGHLLVDPAGLLVDKKQ